MNTILSQILGLFGIGATGFVSSVSIYYLKSYLIILLIAIIGSTPIAKIIAEKLKKKYPKTINILEMIFLIILLIICVAYIVSGSFNPFLYFRF